MNAAKRRRFRASNRNFSVNNRGGIPTSESQSSVWYILPVDNVDECISTLIVSEIPCHDITERYGNSPAIAFPSVYSTKVLELLNKPNLIYTLNGSNVPNMLIMNITGGDHARVIDKPNGPNLEAWSDLVPVIRGVETHFGITLVIDNPHGSAKIPMNSNGGGSVLYVHFWSIPKPSQITTITKVFGYELDVSQRVAFVPSGLGKVLQDNDGVQFAEVYNNHLYILFDLPHGGLNVTAVFASIMKSYFTFKGNINTKLTDFWESVVYGSAPDGQVARELFVNACSNLYKKNLQQMELKLEEYNKTIDTHNQILVNAARERDILMIKLEPLKNSAEERKRWAANEYDILCASPHIKNVKVSDKTIQIFTDMITITQGYSSYNIGEFRIDINTDGDQSGVKAYNLTHPIGVNAHPHIRQNGHCCLGNLSSGVTKLLTDYQYVVLAQLMITYLHTYNPESRYENLDAWSD